MTNSEHSINIRSIQHFMYCQRRWGLLEINRDWSENAFVVKTNILHENVHDGTHSFSEKNKTVRSSVSVYNDKEEYDLNGIADCVEFIKDKNGVEINGLNGLYSVKLIEYKPTAPTVGEFNETDAIQVFAQKLCADFVWGCNCECFIYYSDKRKRVRLPFDTEFEKYDKTLKALLSEMREYISENSIPERVKGQKCSGCSLKDICLPKSAEYSVRKEIEKLGREEIV